MEAIEAMGGSVCGCNKMIWKAHIICWFPSMAFFSLSLHVWVLFSSSSSSILIRRPFEWFVTKFPLYFHNASFIYYFKLGTPQSKYWHSHGLVYSVCSSLCVSLYTCYLWKWKWKYLNVMYQYVCHEYTNNNNNNNNPHTITQICREKQFPQTKPSMKLFTPLYYVRFDAL